jgi:lambda repressor-like predicted transcriptional regulator
MKGVLVTSSISSSLANIAPITLSPIAPVTVQQVAVQQADGTQSAGQVSGRHHRHHHGTSPAMDAAATELGLSSSDLQQSLQSGTSLADLATQKGVSKTDLVSAIAQGMQAAAPANAPSNVNYTAIAQNIVDRPGQTGAPSSATSSSDPSSTSTSPTTDPFSKVSSALGMSESDLLSSLESGTSLTDLLSQNGLSVQDLTAQLGTTQGVAVDTTA